MARVTRRRPAFRAKTCDGCGELFEPNSGRQRWCTPGGCTAEDNVVSTLVERSGAQVGPRPDLDPELQDLIREAVERNAAELEAHGEDRGGGSDYRSAAFPFYRHVRPQPRFDGLDGAGFVDLVEPILDHLLDAGLIDEQPVEVLPRTPWTRALGEVDCFGNVMDPCEDLLKLWDSLSVTPGLAGAVRDARGAEARGRPDHFGAEWASPRYEPRRVFLRVCTCLSVWSREAGEAGEFALALEPLAREIGWPRRTVGDWRSWAEDYGFLRRVAEPERGRAATFRLGPALGGPA